jgi:hypothetical protein
MKSILKLALLVTVIGPVTASAELKGIRQSIFGMD